MGSLAGRYSVPFLEQFGKCFKSEDASHVTAGFNYHTIAGNGWTVSSGDRLGIASQTAGTLLCRSTLHGHPGDFALQVSGQQIQTGQQISQALHSLNEYANVSRYYFTI